jgi:transposase-like protein
MKASNFSDAQKAFILKQGDDGVPVAEICRKAGICQATYFNWRKKYAGLLPDAPLRDAEPRSPQAMDIDTTIVLSCKWRQLPCG